MVLYIALRLPAFLSVAAMEYYRHCVLLNTHTFPLGKWLDIESVILGLPRSEGAPTRTRMVQPAPRPASLGWPFAPRRQTSLYSPLLHGIL